MASEILLFNKYQDDWYQILFNETMVLLSKNDEVFFQLPDSSYKWRFRIRFTSSNLGGIAGDIETEFNEKETVLKLPSWYSDSGVYNLKPLSISSKDGKFNILIKIKTISNFHQDHRTLTISIWKKWDKA